MCATSNDISKVSIMIVDDDDITLECYARLLRGLDCSLSTFTNPLDSLTVLREKQPRLLFVDMNMPCMGGMELLTELFAFTKPENCHIYLCSSIMPPPDIRRRAMDMGVDVICKDMAMDKAWLQNVIQQCR